MPLNLTPEEMLERKREQSRIRNKRFRAAHPEQMRAQRLARKSRMKELQAAWYQKNREYVISKRTAYYKANKASVLSYMQDYGKKNREKIAKRTAAWAANKRATDPDYVKRRSKVCTDYIKRRMKTDPVYRAVSNLRRRLRFYVLKKSDRMMSLIGCSVNQLRAHLASQFEPWMNWSNYGFGPGKWVVDHVKPCSAHDLTDPEQQKLCFHWSNLAPMCWRKNMEKSNKVQKCAPAVLCASLASASET